MLRTWGITIACALIGVCLGACNIITGADGYFIETDETSGDGDGGSRSSGNGSGETVATVGAGGAPATGATSTSAVTTGAGPSATTGASSSSGSGCALPSGPYGAMIGNTVSPSITWQGYADGASQAGTISLADYFDCDGSKGINAILIDESAVWCGPCQDEASDIASHEATWAPKGIHVLTLMIEDASGQPAVLGTATQWKQNFGLGTAVLADPNFSFAGSSMSIGLPLQLVVDPRTFKVIDRQEGYSGSYASLESLAAQNAN
jgi:hypothetical protein